MRHCLTYNTARYATAKPVHIYSTTPPKKFTNFIHNVLSKSYWMSKNAYFSMLEKWKNLKLILDPETDLS